MNLGKFGSFALVGSLVALATAATAEPLKICAGWNNTPTGMAPIIFSDPNVLKHYGKSYIMEPVHFAGAPAELTALAGGDIDIGNFTPATLAFAVENAKMTDIRVIGDELQDGVPGWYSSQFMVLKNGPIKTVEDLKGKVLATNAVGSGLDIQMRAMLRRHHLDEKRDVSILEAPFTALVPMLEEHKVEMIGAIPPYSFIAEAKGNVRTLFTVKDVIGPSETLFDVARTGFIDKNRAALVDFMEDWIRAQRWFTDPANHDRVVKIVATFTKRPPESFASWLFTHEDSYRDPDHRPSVIGLQTALDVQQQMGFQKTHIDAARFVDTSLVDAAAKRID